MTPPVHYTKRRAMGLCVRCGKAGKVKMNGTIAALCQEHLWEHQHYDQRKQEQARDPQSAAPEPPRPAYVSDSLPKMPPIPKACIRCNGFIHVQHQGSDYEEVRCIQCGWRLMPEPIPLEEIDLKKGGPQLPMAME